MLDHAGKRQMTSKYWPVFTVTVAKNIWQQCLPKGFNLIFVLIKIKWRHVFAWYNCRHLTFYIDMLNITIMLPYYNIA